MTLTLPESDRYFDDKLDILERNGLGSSATFNIVRGEDPPVEMMGFLRLMQLQGECVHYDGWYAAVMWIWPGGGGGEDQPVDMMGLLWLMQLQGE